ncbi:MAG: hypothetical protein H6936_17455 [Burkholderiales bacterium]|nr:hypothetical protein [Burkholderiales bacterium]
MKPLRLNKEILILFFLCLICVPALAESSQRTIALVTANDSNISELASIEIRKLFLGVPAMHGKKQLRPLRNSTDKLLTEIFLQKVIFMSERNYEKQLLSRVYRLGGTRPEIYTNKSELVNKIQNTPGALTYMWAEEVADLKTLRVIWSVNVD